jgi:large subunit ribosomal protein L30
MIMKKTIKLKLVKSLIGRLPKHIEIAKQLGLRKINAEVVHSDTPSIRGMVNTIYYLVKIEECA